MSCELRIIGLTGIPEIRPGADLARVIVEAAADQHLRFDSRDIVVVTQKIVSKAEGRLVHLNTVSASAFAMHVGRVLEKDPRLVDVVLRETKRIVKMDQRTIIVETHHGLVCANAGVDESNVSGEDVVALLPEDSDASAARLRDAIRELSGVDVAIIVSDTFGRPWREGFVNVAIGIAGLEPLRDYRGVADTQGHVLKATVLAVADEIASAAELVMNKLDKIPVAVVRGYPYTPGGGTARQLIRPREKDLFR